MDFGIANEVEKSLERVMVKKNDDDNRDHSYLHPSEIGGCPRETYYKTTGIKPLVPPTPQSMRVFSNGDFVHLRYQLSLRDADLLARERIESVKPTSLKIGLEEIQMMEVIGKTGRTYYYSPDEWVWLSNITDGDDDSPPLCKMSHQPRRRADRLSAGDEMWMVEIPIVDLDFHMAGHADAVVKTQSGAAVIDFKSSNDYSFAYLFRDESRTDEYTLKYLSKHFDQCHICGEGVLRWKDMTGHLVAKHPRHMNVDSKHRIQLNIYMWQLGLKSGLILYENKNNQLVMCQPVPRDDILIEHLKDDATTLWSDIINATPPKRPYGSRSKFPCSFCDYASHCWDAGN